MRIEHLFFLRESVEFKDREPTFAEIRSMNANFTGLSTHQMGRYSKEDNLNLFNAILESFSTYKQDSLPLEITYPDSNGKDQTYVLMSDFSKLPYDWWVDRDEAAEHSENFENNPIDLASFVYIEKGMSYGEPDEHDNVKNPRSIRNEVFKKHMPLNLFLDIQSFFLLNWHVLARYSTEAKNQKLRIKKE